MIVCMVQGKPAALQWPKLQMFGYGDGTWGWMLLEDFTVIWDSLRMTVLAGFDYDGASIPRALWTVAGTPMDHDLVVPALFHDVFYASHCLDRETCDVWFREAQRAYGTSAFKAWLRYRAVRDWGWTVWNSNTADVPKYKDMICLTSLT